MEKTMMTMNEIRKAGIDALTKALGPVGMIQFMQQFEMGRGDYTKEREDLLKDISIEEIIEGIKKMEEKRKKDKPEENNG